MKLFKKICERSLDFKGCGLFRISDSREGRLDHHPLCSPGSHREKYLWTGHLSYLGKGENPLVDSAFVLHQFGRSRSQARRSYRRFIVEGLTEVHQEKYYRVKDQRYLGEDEFVEEIEGQKRSHEPVYWEIPLAWIPTLVFSLNTTG